MYLKSLNSIGVPQEPPHQGCLPGHRSPGVWRPLNLVRQEDSYLIFGHSRESEFSTPPPNFLCSPLPPKASPDFVYNSKNAFGILRGGGVRRRNWSGKAVSQTWPQEVHTLNSCGPHLRRLASQRSHLRVGLIQWRGGSGTLGRRGEDRIIILLLPNTAVSLG